MKISFNIETIVHLGMDFGPNLKMANINLFKVNKHFYVDLMICRHPPEEADHPYGQKLTFEPDKDGWFSQYIHRYPYYLQWGGRV